MRHYGIFCKHIRIVFHSEEEEWSRMNRILFFVHYNKYNDLEDYVVYLLEHIKHLYTRIVFISNSHISVEHTDKLSGLYHSLFQRENKGFDFGAWKDALIQEGKDNLAAYDSVTLMNDTCFGPLFSMDAVYEKMEGLDCDFWGMTNRKASKYGMPGTDGPIPEHIQSYFLCFNNNVLILPAFWQFWENVQYEKEVEKVIQKYETKISGILQNMGFKPAVFFDTLSVDIMSLQDVAHNRPYLIFEEKMPLLKIKAFVNFLIPSYIINLIRNKTNYPFHLIYDYFTHIYDPNFTLFLGEKTISTFFQNSINYPKHSTAIHLHVFYLDIFEEYITIFESITTNFDLYITTDTGEKEKEIRNLITNYKTNEKIKEITLVKNTGRNIGAWLMIADKLYDYDIVGHFYTKKSSNEWLGISWQEHIFETLVCPLNTITKLFASNEKIGIIIPDMPYFFRYVKPFDISEEDISSLDTFWHKMNCKKSLDFISMQTLIFPVGAMFWYRPTALRPLLEMQLTFADGSGEIFLSSIERLLVYIAWNENYDYRIMLPNQQLSYFADNILYYRGRITTLSNKIFKSIKKRGLIKTLYKSFIVIKRTLLRQPSWVWS